MATIAITFTHPQATMSRTVTMPDAHMARMITAYKTIYGQIFDPTLNSGAGGMRDRTNAETITALWQGVIDGWTNGVKNQEQTEAAKTAADAITEIDVT